MCNRASKSCRCLSSIKTPSSSWRYASTRSATSLHQTSATLQPKKCTRWPMSRKPAQLSYSTGSSHSSPQGTIGQGQSSIPAEASRLIHKLEVPDHLNEKESEIWHKLNEALDCKELLVQDTSGGCGTMYAIQIASETFRDMSVLNQQRLVNRILGEEIKGWHGVQLKTRAP